MPNKNLRVILDTNLWISFLVTNDFSKLDELILKKGCKLIFSAELLDEFLAVANRPKFRKYFSKADIENVLETINEYAEFIMVTSKIEICRDTKDNFLLSLSVDSNADFLVTGDRDLLDIKRIGDTKIVTISMFLAD
jgi:hypothetical protein